MPRRTGLQDDLADPYMVHEAEAAPPTLNELLPPPHQQHLQFDTVEVPLPSPEGSRFELFRDLMNKSAAMTNFYSPRRLRSGDAMVVRRVVLHAMVLEGNPTEMLRALLFTTLHLFINRRVLWEGPVMSLALLPTTDDGLRRQAEQATAVLKDWMQEKSIPTWVADIMDAGPTPPLPESVFIGGVDLTSATPWLNLIRDDDDISGSIRVHSSAATAQHGKMLVRVGLQGIAHVLLGR